MLIKQIYSHYYSAVQLWIFKLAKNRPEAILKYQEFADSKSKSRAYLYILDLAPYFIRTVLPFLALKYNSVRFKLADYRVRDGYVYECSPSGKICEQYKIERNINLTDERNSDARYCPNIRYSVLDNSDQVYSSIISQDNSKFSTACLIGNELGIFIDCALLEQSELNEPHSLEFEISRIEESNQNIQLLSYLSARYSKLNKIFEKFNARHHSRFRDVYSKRITNHVDELRRHFSVSFDVFDKYAFYRIDLYRFAKNWKSRFFIGSTLISTKQRAWWSANNYSVDEGSLKVALDLALDKETDNSIVRNPIGRSNRFVVSSRFNDDVYVVSMFARSSLTYYFSSLQMLLIAGFSDYQPIKEINLKVLKYRIGIAKYPIIDHTISSSIVSLTIARKLQPRFNMLRYVYYADLMEDISSLLQSISSVLKEHKHESLKSYNSKTSDNDVDLECPKHVRKTACRKLKQILANRLKLHMSIIGSRGHVYWFRIARDKYSGNQYVLSG